MPSNSRPWVPKSSDRHASQPDESSDDGILAFFPPPDGSDPESAPDDESELVSEHASAARSADTGAQTPDRCSAAAGWQHEPDTMPVPVKLEKRCAVINLRLKTTLRMCVGGRSFACSKEYGLMEMSIPARVCRRLLHLICNSRCEYGLLRLAGVECPGLSAYPSEARTQEYGVRYRAQEQWTSVIPEDKVQLCIKREPSLGAVVDLILRRLGASRNDVAMVHMLCQFNPFAVFPWHDDAYDLQLSKNMLTVVCSLNDVPSGMQVYGFDPFMYSGTGCVAAFLGAAIHRSVARRTDVCSQCIEQQMIWNGDPARGPVKLVLFLDKI